MKIPHLFLRSGRTPARAAPSVQLVKSDKKMLALGLSWSLVVVSPSKARANILQKAKLNAATHVVHSNRWAGLGRCDNKTAVLKDTAAGALVAASLAGEGPHLFVIRLDPARTWVCLLECGDQSATALTVAEDLIEDSSAVSLFSLVEKHKARNPALTVWSNLDFGDIAQDDLPESQRKDCDLMQLFKRDFETRFLLTAIGQRSKVRTAMTWAGVVLTLCILGAMALNWWRAEQATQALRLQQQMQQLAENPLDLWRSAYKRWALGVAAPGNENFETLMGSVLKLPMLWQSWALDKLTCKLGQLNAKPALALAQDRSQAQTTPTAAPPASGVAWQCQAVYKRGAALSTNSELMANPVKAVDTAQIEFQGFDVAVLNWSVPAPQSAKTAPLQLDLLKSKQGHQLSTVALLQAHSLLLTELVPLTFVPVTALIAPTRADGTGVPMPVSMGRITQSPVTIKGPLRSVNELLLRGFKAHWTELSLNVNALTAQPSTRISAYTAELKGSIYAQD
jgi:hypothetical protein